MIAIVVLVLSRNRREQCRKGRGKGPTAEEHHEQLELYRNVVDGKSIAFFVILFSPNVFYCYITQVMALGILVSMDTASTKRNELDWTLDPGPLILDHGLIRTATQFLLFF